MEIAELETFREVARCGSFTAAAQRLHLSQPAVSKRIQALERELGGPLFDRMGRRVVLTEAGRALLARAERILAEVEEARRGLHRLVGRVAGRLPLAISHHVGLRLLPQLLRRYSARYPEVELDLHFADSEGACRMVSAGDLELAVVTLPPRPMEGLRFEPVWRERLVVASAPDHPLARRRSVTAEDLSRHAAVLPGVETCTRGIIEEGLARIGVKVRERLATNYMETVRVMISVGLGWGCLPASMVDDGLVVHRVPGLVLRRQLGAVTHVHRTLSNPARAFLDMLREERPAPPSAP
ncbi:LysR family transcriptional regulator [Inmirania thermothiophila]|uniref:LysR family transcriptional regulator n=1 Tax=Inmirania thermothiophila TaxID=1750597 RepID=A0A3N1Y1X6_9GAMM|nr:LysR family transcriptional regulator [Inmirania thermothiophila]ROR32843.1 LysR family transcriptional regulator [Inmirania thermothiophila]